MSFKQKPLRIPFKLAEEFERDAEQLNISENEYCIQAIEHFLNCKKTEEIQSMKLIVLRYPATCLKCSTKMEVGQHAYWGRGTGAICLDCQVARYGDKTIVKKYIKLKELEFLIKSLQAQCNEKAEEMRQFNFYEKINNLHELSKQARDLVTSYLKENFQKPEKEQQTLDELERLMEKTQFTIKDLEQFMKVPLQKKKREAEAYTT